MDHVHLVGLVRRVLFAVTLVVVSSACHKWVEVEPPDLTLEQQSGKTAQDRGKLRLHIAESDEKIEGYLAELTQDSTVLVTEDGRAALETSLIAQVDERRSNALGTAALVLAPVVLALLIAGSFEGDSF